MSKDSDKKYDLDLVFWLKDEHESATLIELKKRFAVPRTFDYESVVKGLMAGDATTTPHDIIHHWSFATSQSVTLIDEDWERDKQTDLAVIEPSAHHAPIVQPTPPRVLEKFLWLALPAGLRDAILGDAEENFNRTYQKYGSLNAARWDYCKEVVCGLGAAVLMLWDRLAGAFKQRQ